MDYWGGPKGMLAPLSNYWGGGGLAPPPLPTPMILLGTGNTTGEVNTRFLYYYILEMKLGHQIKEPFNSEVY